MRLITTSNFSHREVFALRGNIERMNSPIQDPYAHENPGDIGTGGVSYLTRMGDEDGMSGSASVGGTRARKGFPRGTSAKEDDYDIQRERDIPASDHMFIDDENSMGNQKLRQGILTGIDSTKRQDFTDERERPVTDEEIWGMEAPRIQTMNVGIGRINKRYKNTKERIKGAYL